MPPNIKNSNGVLLVEETHPQISKAEPRKYEIVYSNILIFTYYHLAGIYGLYLAFTSAMWSTLIFYFFSYWIAACGIVAGSHRLWSHRSYKATKPLQIFLMLAHSLANQHTAIHWARDHRLHHKYSDTDADPHNASRGFFYSHVGWLFVKKHPEVTKRGEMIDISDLTSNPILMFQHRHQNWFLPFMSLVLPTIACMYFFGETFNNAYHLNMLRYIVNLNMTFAINSVAHMFGYKPYDKNMAATQNGLLFFMTEGGHNYHHVFPWDYKTDGIGLFSVITTFIDICAFLGLAYDRRYVDEEIVIARARRTGDGSVYK